MRQNIFDWMVRFLKTNTIADNKTIIRTTPIKTLLVKIGNTFHSNIAMLRTEKEYESDIVPADK